ncbi:hypothetical protein GCM10028791_27270 [Echinicola sediminis]
MIKTNIKLLLGCLGVLLGFSCSSSSYDVTVASLLDEMVDREQLAKLNTPAYSLEQVSSRSEESIGPNEPGWFHNGDSKIIGNDSLDKGREHVLMDVEGPGAIVRFWSAWNPQPASFSNGILRIYIDHSETPELEGKLGEIISHNAAIGAPLSRAVSSFLENDKWYAGHNLYFPIPFARHIKITYQKANQEAIDGIYYIINYRKYDAGIRVKSFRQADLEAGGSYAELTQRTNKELQQFPNLDGLESISGDKKNLESGGVSSLEVSGSKAIKKLTVKIDAEHLEQALRSTVLSMEFDEKNTVWAPLGDFFGTGYMVSPYKSRYSVVEEDGKMSCYFPMPFSQSAKVSIHNYGEQEVKLLTFEAVVSDWEWDDKSLYFHADWKNYPDISTQNKQDLNYIHIKGKGKHVGDVLTLFNNSYYWWGEGDEKIYVDGTAFPSHFGTGTEDYFGYAWCSVVDFESPFHAQPSGDGNRSPGMTVNSRWRMLDVTPFDESYRFDMELWHWDNHTTMDYAPTVFWYGTKEAYSINEKDISGVTLPVKFPERFEGEGMKLVSKSGGEMLTQAFLSYEWSGRNHLFWKDFDAKDELEVKFYSPEKREGKLKLVFSQAPSYAVVDVYLNGNKVVEDLDLFEEELGRTTVYGEQGLVLQGENFVTIVAKDQALHSVKTNEFGFDYLMIENED